MTTCLRVLPPLFLVAASLIMGGGRAGEAADPPAARPFRAGAAAVEITPRLGLPIVGGFSSPVAVRVHDPLHARCLLLDDGKTIVGFVVCDNLGISVDVFTEARKKIAAAGKVPADNLVMAATHTHSGVSASGEMGMIVTGRPLTEYQQLLAEKVAEVVAAAAGRLAPAKVGWGRVDEPSEVFNRRWYVRDEKLLKNPFGGVDKVRMNPPAGSAALIEPAGPIDPAVSFLSVKTADGKPLALLANYSLHYVGGVPSGDISADYFAVFARQVGRELGVPEGDTSFVGMMSNGTSGDINNINFRQKRGGQEPYEQMEAVGTKIARRVAEAEKTITYHDRVPVASATASVTLAVRRPTEAIQAGVAAVKAHTGETPLYHVNEKTYAGRVDRLVAGPETIEARLQAVRVGDLAIVTSPFETFVEIGLALREASPFAATFTIELANGYYGYLPTPRQHELGGYETWLGTNNVEVEASDKLVAKLTELLRSLHEGMPAATPGG